MPTEPNQPETKPLVDENRNLNQPKGPTTEVARLTEHNKSLVSKIEEGEKRLASQLKQIESLHASVTTLEGEITRLKSVAKVADSGDEYIGPSKKEIMLAFTSGFASSLDATKLNDNLIKTFAKNIPGIAAIIHSEAVAHKNFRGTPETQSR